MNFLERTLAGFLDAMDHALRAEALAKAKGLLQRLDPRVKVIGILALIIAAATAHKLWVIAAVFLIALSLALASRVSLLLLAKRVWVPVILFTGVIALPAPLAIPGRGGLAAARAGLAADGARVDECAISDGAG